MLKFSDFAEEEKSLDGEKKKIDDILNVEVIVLGERIRNSKYKEKGERKYAQIQVELSGKKYVIFTGSSVIINQIEKYRKKIPFITTIKKIDRYYTLA